MATAVAEMTQATAGLFGTNEIVTFDRDAADRLGRRLL